MRVVVSDSVKVDISPVTTGWWYQWLMSIRGECDTPEAVRMLSQLMSIKQLNRCIDERVNLIEVGERIIIASSIDTRSMAALFTVTYMAQDYDQSKSGGPCECRECRGMIDEDEHCLFRQEPIRQEDRLLSLLDLDLVSELWDRPVSLYQLTRERDSAKIRGKLAHGQERERNEERNAIRNDIFDKHGVH
jgi:hypothetical protein